MHAQRAPPALSQYLEIAARLRRLHNSKSIFLLRNRKVESIIASHLQKHSRIRTTLISLSRGMQKTRAKSQAGRDPFPLANRVPYRLQVILMLGIHLDISKYR